MSLSIDVDASKIEKRLGTILKYMDFEEPLRGTAVLLKKEIKKNAPKAFHVLEESIDYKSVKKNEIEVYSDAPHAPIVEYGRSKPTFLKFIKNGVKQPIWYWAKLKGLDIGGKKGMTVSGRPQKFFFKTLVEQRKAIKGIFDKYLTKIMRITQ